MSMRSSFFPSWYIIEIIDPFYIKGKSIAILNNRKVSLTIRMVLIELYNRAIKHIRLWHIFSLLDNHHNLQYNHYDRILYSQTLVQWNW